MMNKNKKISVSGIAIREGLSRNGVLYTREELEKFAPTLEGKPILKDHRAEVDNTIGLVTASESSENGMKVNYSGWVKEDGTGVTEKIEDKRIKEVSIGAVVGKLVKESEDSDYVIAKDMHAMELSLTPTPGVKGTSISQSFKVDESTGKNKQIKKIIENSKDFKNIEEKTLEKSHLTDHKSDSEIIKLQEANIMEDNHTMENFVSKEEFDALKSQLDAINEEKKTVLTERYSKVCKNLKISEMKDLTLETLKVLVEQLEEVSEQPTEEVTEDAPAEESEESADEEEAEADESEEKSEEVEESEVEDSKDEEEVEEPETKSEVSNDEVAEESINGYAFESADKFGMSFYRAR